MERNPRAGELDDCLGNAVEDTLQQNISRRSHAWPEEWMGESSTDKAEHNLPIKMSVIWEAIRSALSGVKIAHEVGNEAGWV